MALSSGQQQVALDAHRFRVVIAGRRWGKTHLAIRELAKSVRLPEQRSFYVAPTYRMAKQIVWDPLKYRLMDLNWVERVNESDLTIQLINGSKISLRGADNPDSLRGVGLNFVVMDEFAWIDEKAWSEVLRPTLSDRSGSAMFISTPVGKSNWAYRMWQNNREDPDNWSSYQFTTLSGGRVPETEIQQAHRDLDARTFRQEYEATFEEFAGRIYYSYTEANLVRYTDPVPQEILVFCDFNVSPVTAAIAVRTAQGIHIIDEIMMYSSNTDELVQEIRNRYPTQRVTAFPDPAGTQRKTSAGGRTDISILENARFTVKYHRSHPPVRDRINAVNSALCSSTGEIKLRIDPRCRRVLECLERQTYKEGTQIPDKDAGYDHMNDAIGYGIEYLMPVRRDIVQVAPRSWGHRIT